MPKKKKEVKPTLRINWTPEKKDAVCAKLEEWLQEHRAWGGEKIMQDDDCQIDAPELISDIVDDIIKPEILDEEEED